MRKKHDEKKDLKCVSRIAEIDGDHIIIPANSVIGIHTWGRIDFLVHYCGYVLNRSNNIRASNLNAEDAEASAREAKKIKKEHKLTNKKK